MRFTIDDKQFIYSQGISALESCLNSLHIWFCENGMALNSTTSVAILFGTGISSGLKSYNVAGTDIQLSDKVKILGPRYCDARLQSHHRTPYQGFIQLLLLLYSIAQAYSFIFR